MLDLRLRVNGVIYGGWKSVNVTFSLERLAGTFELVMADRDSGAVNRMDIHPGNWCELFIQNPSDEYPVISGWIDNVNVAYGQGDHSLVVTGRDVMGDLVDCSAGVGTVGEWQDARLENIVSDLTFIHGGEGDQRTIIVQVERGADTGEPFKHVKINLGETAFEVIARLCKQRAVIPYSMGDGVLRLGRAGDRTAYEKLVYGENIKAAQITNSNLERFRHYYVVGQAQGSDLMEPDEFTNPFASAWDRAIVRDRPMMIVAETQGDKASLTRRAKWESTYRAGKSRQIAYIVQGWTMKTVGEQLWPLNSLVSITDPIAGLDKEKWLISGVSFNLDESGSSTELTVTHPGAFALSPEDDKAGEIGKAFDILANDS